MAASFAEIRRGTESDIGRIRAIETAIRSKQWQASRLGRAKWGQKVEVAQSRETMLIVRNFTGVEWEEKAREQALLHPAEDRPPRLN